MTEDDWKIGYKKSVLNVFAKEGIVKTPEHEYYHNMGGVDYKKTEQIQTHLKNCWIDPILSTMPIDVTWDQFRGTFWTGTTQQVGLDATVTCHCGFYKKINMRMEGSFGDLLRAVLEN